MGTTAINTAVTAVDTTGSGVTAVTTKSSVLEAGGRESRRGDRLIPGSFP
jgi:hypothetical protein